MADKVILKAFPDQISEEIELPDIAELLMQPIFFDTDIDEVYKHGTDFQRLLLDKTPLRNTKKQISVLSQVRMIAPNYRSCTDFLENPNREWHIDCEEKLDTGLHIYTEERDIVHLLTNQTTAMAEFNRDMLELDLSVDTEYMDFCRYVGANPKKIVPQAMPANRIVTFTNHLHRATNPTKIEFRYMWRIVESDRHRETNPYNKHYVTTITGAEGEEQNITHRDDKIVIFIPKSLRNDVVYEPKVEARPEPKVKPEPKVDIDIKTDTFPSLSDFTPIEDPGPEVLLNIHHLECKLIEGAETFVFKALVDPSIDVQDTIIRVDKKIRIGEIESPTNGFSLSITNLEYDKDNGVLSGSAKIPWDEVIHLKDRRWYFVEFSETGKCRFITDTSITTIYSNEDSIFA